MKDLTPAQAAKPRKRRLRKKLHLGDFQELGFSVEVRLMPSAVPTFDQALDAWIDFVESRTWAFGGGGSMDSRKFWGFVTRFGSGTLTEEDRRAAKTWLNETSWTEGGEVGPLQDAWHGG